MRAQTRLFPVLIVLLIVASAVCFGQAAAINGQIVGTVADPSGAAVAGASVRARNVGTGFTQTVTTSEGGLYRFNVLPLGDYEVKVEAPGFASVRRTGIALNAGATATIDFALSLSSVSSEVVVSAAAPVVDPSRTDLGSTLSNNAVTNLPLVSRNPYNFILLQPNVTGRENTEFGVPRKVDANGFNGRINYQLDGSNNTESDRAGIRLLPISDTWIQEVQTVSNGFAPEFGNTVGTVFNTVTKSGANDYHGEGGWIFRRTPFSARPALLAPSVPAPELNVDTLFADGGGRIVKDKLFFFGSYEHVKRDLPTVVSVSPATISQLGLPANFADPIPFSQNVAFILAKADWQLNEKNRLSIRYSGHRNDSPYNNGGGLVLLPQTYNFVDRSYAGAVQLISALSPNAVNELRVQIPYRSQQQNAFSATGAGPSITVSGVASFGGSPNVGFKYQEKTPELTDNFSYNLGSHSLKFGASARWIRDTQVQSTSATYTFSTIAAYVAAENGSAPTGYASFAQTLGNPSMDYNSLFSGFYGQDTWKPRSNVTITYGLRYDVYVPPSAPSSAPFAFSRNFRTDKNNFAPRLGVAVGLGKWVARASGGIFYDAFQTDQYRRAILNNGTPGFFSVSLKPTSTLAPSFPTVFAGIPSGFTLPLQDITTVDPGFSTLYSINGNFSVSRELTSTLGFTATYLYTRGNRLPVYRNINLTPGGSTLADGRPIYTGTGAEYPGFGNIISAESVGHSTYNGLNLTLTKRLSHGLELFGTYTWAHALDDAPEQNNIDAGAFYLSDPSNRRRDYGNSLTDRRHVFNAHAVWTPVAASQSRLLRYLASNNTLALALNAQSGEVFNLASNRVLNGDASTPATFQRPLFVGRNTLNAPATVQLNVRYTRLIPIGERFKGEFFGESTNILNHTNVTGLNATARVDAAGSITTPASLAWTSALDHRLIQLGLRLIF
jgi:hypothetical protein